ncbi:MULTISPECIES: FixH family protein [unclassified Shimia]|uniref:FixH family protein n=1 Tax=unclassified Shimia TaxID=2630038 RepID=UPI0033426F49
MAEQQAEKKFTGFHFLMIFVCAFGVIIAVNITLAWQAVATFPGLEVKNSYVASQEFDQRRDAQEALGWTVSAKSSGGLLILSIIDVDGRPVQVSNLQAVLGRATHVQDDREPDFQFDGKAYVAREELKPGNWNIRMKATALDGTAFEQRVVLRIEKS